jgi:hypothetical protein
MEFELNSNWMIRLRSNSIPIQQLDKGLIELNSNLIKWDAN